MRLSPAQFLGCWAALRLGEPPVELALRPPGHTVEESRALLDQAVAGLAGRGLSDGRRPGATPHPGLGGALRLVARPDYLLDIRFRDLAEGGGVVFGLGAVAGAAGLLITGVADGQDRRGEQGGDPVELLGMDASRVAGALLGLATRRGPVKAGIGSPANIPVAAFDTARQRTGGGGLWELADELVNLGVAWREARSLARMCTGVRFAGQLGATGRFAGPARRGGWVVGFHVTDSGWFLQLRRGDTLTVCPTGTRRLMYHWHELIDSLNPATSALAPQHQAQSRPL
ncbi:MAG TPA: ESX secretion-associated protein EspG [Pseudonocardiaceae bacterium]|nr:ESX secretion-associated protein EspG [Pseudonocardiaceae bacterium]